MFPSVTPSKEHTRGLPIGVEDFKAIDVQDTDDGVLPVDSGIIIFDRNDLVDAGHDPAEKPLVDGL